jgi:hypothetical protein
MAGVNKAAELAVQSAEAAAKEVALAVESTAGAELESGDDAKAEAVRVCNMLQARCRGEGVGQSLLISLCLTMYQCLGLLENSPVY